MPDSITPNLNLIKPEISGSDFTWGGKLNENFDIIDQKVHDNETNISALTQSTNDSLALKADINSPALTGIPTAPTAAPTTATEQIATTEFVQQAVDATISLLKGSPLPPTSLDTLSKLATAIGNDSSYALTIAAQMATKANLNSPALTGTPTAPTPTSGDNSLRIATTAFIQSLLTTYATQSWVNSQLSNAFKPGMIVLWPFSLETIPTGWVLCDGANGTPDMRDRFPVGAGSSYALNAVGGLSQVQLTIGQMPSHNHGGATTVAGWHSHQYITKNSEMVQSGSNTPCWVGSTWASTQGDGNHQHGIYAEGSNQAHENRPPYRALYFIMKV